MAVAEPAWYSSSPRTGRPGWSTKTRGSAQFERVRGRQGDAAVTGGDESAGARLGLLIDGETVPGHHAQRGPAAHHPHLAQGGQGAHGAVGQRAQDRQAHLVVHIAGRFPWDPARAGMALARKTAPAAGGLGPVHTTRSLAQALVRELLHHHLPQPLVGRLAVVAGVPEHVDDRLRDLHRTGRGGQVNTGSRSALTRASLGNSARRAIYRAASRPANASDAYMTSTPRNRPVAICRKVLAAVTSITDTTTPPTMERITRSLM